jgi:hypothetical protein
MNSLTRILRLRALLEEVSRVKLENLAQQVARIERARERERDLASAGRREAFSLIAETGVGIASRGGRSGKPAQEERILAEVTVEIAAWRERQMEPLAKAAARRVEAASEEFFLRRKERRQLETLLQDRAALRRIERDRRDQRTLDDWFAATRDRNRRRRLPGNSAE